MRYEQNKELDNEEFRRLTGVKKATFSRMVEILDEEDRRKKARSGRKSKLCIEDRLLMALEYLREYRTYFHIGRSYGIASVSKVSGRHTVIYSRYLNANTPRDDGVVNR